MAPSAHRRQRSSAKSLGYPHPSATREGGQRIRECVPIREPSRLGFDAGRLEVASRAGEVADAGARFGEGFEPIGFDGGCEFRERSPDETEVDRTDDGLVGGRYVLEGAAFQHELVPAVGLPELGLETVLLVETDDLVECFLLRDRGERGRFADEVCPPRLSGLFGASAGVRLRAEGAGEDLGEEAVAGERAFVGWLRGLVEDARPAALVLVPHLPEGDAQLAGLGARAALLEPPDQRE